ncbi:MAG: cell division protein, partial [Bacteroidota bacterium]
MSIKKGIVLRVRIAFLLTFLVAGAVIFRIVKVQYVEGEQWRLSGDSVVMKVKNIDAIRGNIYADDGSLLSTSLPFYQLAIDPTIASNKLFDRGIDSLCFHLAKYYKDKSSTQYRKEIDKARKKGREYLLLNRQQIGYQDKKRMQKWPLVRDGRLKGGVFFEKIQKRFQPFGQ